MRQVILLLLLAISSGGHAFADAQAAAVMVYDGNLFTIGSEARPAEKMLYGGEMRVDILFMQAVVTALDAPSPGQGDEILLLADAGVRLNLSSVTLTLGIGPDFWLTPAIGGAPSMETFNARATFEVNIGAFSVGVVGWYFVPWLLDLPSISQSFSRPPVLGIMAAYSYSRY